jgi:hypothetical protein
MMKTRQIIAGTAVVLANAFLATGASALSSQTYVDARGGVAADVGTCPVTAPCGTLSYALSQTAANGGVQILVGGTFEPVVLTSQVNIAAPPDGSTKIIADPTAVTWGCVGAAPGSCGSNNGYAMEITGAVTDTFKFKNVLFSAGPAGNGAIKVNSAFGMQFTGCIFRGNGTTTNAILTFAPSNGGGNQFQLFFGGGDIAYNKNGGALLIQPIGNTPTRVHFAHTEIHNASFGLKADGTLMSAGVTLRIFAKESEYFSFNNNAANAFTTVGTGIVQYAMKSNNVFNAGLAGINSNGPGTSFILVDNVVIGNSTGVNMVNGGTVATAGTNEISANGTNVAGGSLITGAPWSLQ